MSNEPSFYEALEFDDVNKIYKCRWCDCIFYTLTDFISHWKAIGKLQWDHRRRWKELKQNAAKYG